MLPRSVKWIFAGLSNELETTKRKDYIEEIINNIAQMIYQAIKSGSQLGYNAISNGDNTFYNTKKQHRPFLVKGC